MRQVELMVIGAGPSGLAAARTAAGLGLETLLIDENPIDPANIRRNIPYWYGPRAAARAGRRADPFAWLSTHPGLALAVEAGVELLIGTCAWGVFPAGDAATHVIGLFDGTRTTLVRARCVILATGATDLHLAFPGWTRSGVLGGRGALHLLEMHGYLEAQRMLVLGSGSLALEVFERARAAGVEIVGLVEPADRPQAEALQRADVRVWLEHTLRLVRGGGNDVQEAVLAPVTGGQDETVAVDTVCVAIDRQPSIELACLAGCQLAYDPRQGGHYLSHDADQRTSRPGVLTASDEVGGGCAAHTAAAWLAGGQTWSSPLPAVAARRGAYPTRWHELADRFADDDLIVCRCEEITRGEVLGAARLDHSTDPNEIKRLTRAGMGLCQGRGCRPIIAGMLAARSGRGFADIPISTYRPPVRPLPLAALATEEPEPAPDLEPFAEPDSRS